MFCDVIVDLQSGDTGKGKVTHHLLKSATYDLVLRYNGGSNAGHTIYHEGNKIVTHQVPAGVLYGIRSLIGLGCVVNIAKLNGEIEYLKEQGIDTTGLIFVDKRCHVICHEHLEEDNKDLAIGTTKQGIGPAYKSKYGREGVRIGSIALQSNQFQVVDSLDMFDSSKSILAEGAQGFSLDIDWGDYPYVTSSHCTAGSVCLNGIPPKNIRKVFGVAKVYETYVGAKQFGMTHPAHKDIQKEGQEFGATTGRPRKVNWINLDTIKQAIKVNGITDIIFNKLDVLSTVGVFGYIENGKENIVSSMEEFKMMLSRFEILGINVTFSNSPYEI